MTPTEVENLLNAARNNSREYGNFERAVSKFHLAQAHIIAGLACAVHDLRTQHAAEVRELRRDKARLDWILDDDFARYDPRRKEYRDRIDTREDIDGFVAAKEA